MPVLSGHFFTRLHAYPPTWVCPYVAMRGGGGVQPVAFIIEPLLFVEVESWLKSFPVEVRRGCVCSYIYLYIIIYIIY